MGRNLTRAEMAIAAALFAMLAGILLILAFHEVPKENQTLFTSLASGVVGAGAMALLNFLWGSSSGSQAKDATISALSAPTPPSDPSA